MKLLIALIFMVFLTSCTDQNNAKKVADQYCTCMQENGFPSRRIYAGTICHSELLKNNRLYRIFFIDRRDAILSEKLTKSTLDSVQGFMRKFVSDLPIEMRETTTDVIVSIMGFSLQTGRITDFLMDQEVIYNKSLSKPVDSVKIKNGLISEDDLLTEYYYRNGKKNGVFKNYFKRNHKLHVLGFYKDDEPVGTWYSFNEEGEIRLIEIVKGINKDKRVRNKEGVMIKPPFISYRKEYDSKTGELKREGLRLSYKNVDSGFYEYGHWKEY